MSKHPDLKNLLAALTAVPDASAVQQQQAFDPNNPAASLPPLASNVGERPPVALSVPGFLGGPRGLGGLAKLGSRTIGRVRDTLRRALAKLSGKKAVPERTKEEAMRALGELLMPSEVTAADKAKQALIRFEESRVENTPIGTKKAAKAAMKKFFNDPDARAPGLTGRGL